MTMLLECKDLDHKYGKKTARKDNVDKKDSGTVAK